jgi:hypothetical protein
LNKNQRIIKAGRLNNQIFSNLPKHIWPPDRDHHQDSNRHQGYQQKYTPHRGRDIKPPTPRANQPPILRRYRVWTV